MEKDAAEARRRTYEEPSDILSLSLYLYNCTYKSLIASPQYGPSQSNNGIIEQTCDQKLARLTCELASWKTPHT